MIILRRLQYPILFAFILITACKPSQTTIKSEGNHLLHETSPYLLQHAKNPVDWYPWNDEALAKAKSSRKLMIISIGYSSCHWCHVMEKESFSDTAVSRIMNKDFISIKVDREERPDIDNVYMTACQLLNQNGSCGWPLNAIALSDGRPIWVGTYLPKQEWIKILNNIQSLYNEDPNELEKMAMQAEHHLEVDHSAITGVAINPFDVKKVTDALNSIQPALDFMEGGRKGNMKFPMPTFLRFLLEAGQQYNHPKSVEFVQTTLQKMANGGLNDALTGGFARYSTDPNWRVPHFEKMLYDNGQLVSIYAQAYQKTSNPFYKKIIDQTLDFVNKELKSPEGVFYSSYNADSEHEEGKYYKWTMSEINSLIPDPGNRTILIEHFGLTENGNWENGKNVLAIKMPVEDLAKKLNKPLADIEKSLSDSKAILLMARSKRVKPSLDDKILTAWNAQMIKGFADAYAATGNEEYKITALKAADFIKTKMIQSDNTIMRNYKEGKTTIHGFLDDYAFTIDAFIRLYEITFDENWLQTAKKLNDIAVSNYSDDQNILFYYNSKLDQKLIARKTELDDQVVPSTNSAMADNLHRLGLYFYDQKYLDRAEKMVGSVMQTIGAKDPGYYSNWIRVYAEMARPLYEVAVVGPDALKWQKQLLSKYLPQSIFMGGTSEGSLELLKEKLQAGSTYIYVCRNKTCKLPVQEVNKAISLMN